MQLLLNSIEQLIDKNCIDRLTDRNSWSMDDNITVSFITRQMEHS